MILFHFLFTKERELKKLCVLQWKKLRGKTALQVLEEYGNKNSIPIDLESLIKSIGISVLPMDFTELENRKNQGHIMGLVLSDEKNAVIYYSSQDRVNRQRFTIAHELGHICLTLSDDKRHFFVDWRRESESDDENNLHEKNANIFAGELLIPFHKLKEEYMNMRYPNSVDLAYKFGVSVNVMEKRLEHLGIMYFNRRGQAVTYD